MSNSKSQNRISLPMGAKMVHSTVRALGLVQIDYSVRKVKEETESGWPTLITGTHADDESDFGIAVDYHGKWHKTPAQEIYLYLKQSGSDWEWTIIVAFDDVESAESAGSYHTHGYEGFESIPYDEVADGVPYHLTDENITPIVHFKDYDFGIDGPEISYAYAVQRSTNFGVLKSMFDLQRYDTLIERKKQLWELVVPRESRWEREDTGLQNIAKNVLESDDDSEKERNP